MSEPWKPQPFIGFDHAQPGADTTVIAYAHGGRTGGKRGFMEAQIEKMLDQGRTVAIARYGQPVEIRGAGTAKDITPNRKALPNAS